MKKFFSDEIHCIMYLNMCVFGSRNCNSNWCGYEIGEWCY